MSDAQQAARHDRRRERFAVYPADGSAFRGTWCRVPARFTAKDLYDAGAVS